MFILGHLGFGRALAQPLRKSILIAPLLFGAILPDLIDKPLFVLFPDVFQGSRGVAHTLLFLLLAALVAKIRRSRAWFSIALGIATHLFLDNVGDLFVVHQYGLASNCKTLFWPLLGFDFPAALHLSLHEQAEHLSQPYFVATELIGLILLIWFLGRDRFKARKSKAARKTAADESSPFKI